MSCSEWLSEIDQLPVVHVLAQHRLDGQLQVLQAVARGQEDRELRSLDYARAMGGSRVLLTGGSGFIGSRAIAPLLAAGYEVHALGAPRPATADRPRSLARSSTCSTTARRADAVAEIAAEQLLHLAWFTEHGRFWSAPENLDWVAASLRLLRAFAEAGGRRAVLAGTCAEYDWAGAESAVRELDGGDGPATPEAPATLYGACKHATRLVADAYAREAGLSLAWGRVFLLYGPGEDQRRLVPQVARALLAGRAGADQRRRAGARLHARRRRRRRLRRAARAAPSRAPSTSPPATPSRIADVLALIARAAGHPELLRLGALHRRAGDPERLVADVTAPARRGRLCSRRSRCSGGSPRPSLRCVPPSSGRGARTARADWCCRLYVQR